MPSKPVVLPAHLSNYKRGTGVENLTIEDIGWVGIDGDLDTDAVIKEHGYDSISPLDYILHAIVRAHPVEGRRISDQERVEVARKALIGAKRQPGADEQQDYDILLAIAWQYFWEFHSNDCKPPAVRPIVRACVDRLPADDRRRNFADIDSVYRRFEKKFKKHRDLLLARATLEVSWNRMDVVRAIKEILSKMESLGIRSDRDSVRAQLRPKDTMRT